MKKHKKALGGCLCVHGVLAGEDDEADGDERVALDGTTSASFSLDGHYVCCCNFVGGEVKQL